MPVPTRIPEPTLLLDTRRALANLERMAERARAAGARLRPHAKTHQSQAIARWCRELGIEALTVSSLQMAEYFADDGWDDLTLAFPFHPGMRDRVQALATRGRMGITLADAAALDGVAFDVPVDAWLKIDVGTHRTGFAHDDPALELLTHALASRGDIRLRGLLAHAGHSYAARSEREVLRVHADTLALLAGVRDRLAAGVGPLELSFGDTPTCSLAETFPGVDELRPGNYVFYDLSQWQIGACGIDDIAVAMACPVVARHPERGELVVHGGAVHFSKDAMDFEGERVFGLAVNAADDGWGELDPDLRLVRLSQEHGIVSAPPERIAAIRPGDVLLFLPVHSCLTADAMGGYLCLDGNRIGMLPRTGEPR